MTEIERIISQWMQSGVDTRDCAKEIEQYVIKARIEELENVHLNSSSMGETWKQYTKRIIDRTDERIAQLKKGLTDD